ncbi:hypothetical protein [Halobacillus sp. A5]|uniref:hypothetical protein n=1 Tax=Halobacillus sp. A5 TaxID=2880263 RepID=UPI0020A66678|nr:hypothetical protein [Halobacillus sp. A5]MCP3025997.1 hypothetical protein [Halobacillus sp. A5]
MSMNSIIINALKPYAPVAFHHYTGTETTYITFFTYNERSGLIADDDEVSTVYSIQVDIHSKGNLETLEEQVKEALKKHGFRRTWAMEVFNIETKTYRKNMSFRLEDFKE